MTEYAIKEVTIAMYPQLLAAWQATPGIGLSSADSHDGIARFLVGNPGGAFAAVCGDERIIGGILTGNDSRRGYIYHAFVLPEYRGRGIGRKLVEKALGQLSALGIEKSHLFVFIDNCEAQEFWKHLGWQKRDDIAVYSLNH